MISCTTVENLEAVGFWNIEAFACSFVIYQFISELRKLLEAVDYLEADDFVEIEAPFDSLKTVIVSRTVVGNLRPSMH